MNINTGNIKELYDQTMKSVKAKSDGGVEITETEMAKLKEIAAKDGISPEEQKFLDALGNKVNVAKLGTLSENKDLNEGSVHLDLELEDEPTSNTKLSTQELKNRFDVLSVNYNILDKNTGTEKLITDEQITFKDFKRVVNSASKNYNDIDPDKLSSNDLKKIMDLSKEIDKKGKVDISEFIRIFQSHPGLLDSVNKGEISSNALLAILKSESYSGGGHGNVNKLDAKELVRVGKIIDQLGPENTDKILEMVTSHTRVDLTQSFGDIRDLNASEKEFIFSLLENTPKDAKGTKENKNIDKVIEFIERGVKGNTLLRDNSVTLSKDDLERLSKDPDTLKNLALLVQGENMSMENLLPYGTNALFFIMNGTDDINNAITQLLKDKVPLNADVLKATASGSVSDKLSAQRAFAFIDKEIKTLEAEIKTASTPEKVKQLENANAKKEIFTNLLDAKGSNAEELINTFIYLDKQKINYSDVKEVIKNQGTEKRDKNDILAAVQAYAVVQEGLKLDIPNKDNLQVVSDKIKSGKLRIDDETKEKLPEGYAMYSMKHDTVYQKGFNIGSTSGRALLLHELTHAAQDNQFAGAKKKATHADVEAEAYLVQALYLESYGIKSPDPTAEEVKAKEEKKKGSKPEKEDKAKEEMREKRELFIANFEYAAAYKKVRELEAKTNPTDADKEALKKAKEDLAAKKANVIEQLDHNPLYSKNLKKAVKADGIAEHSHKH